MTYDVIIAGAGPVGLFLARELRLAKVSVLVLEQQDDLRSPLKRLPFGRRGLWGPSMEAFYRRGLLEQVVSQTGGDDKASGPPRPASIGAQQGPAGHFAGIQFDYANVDTARWTYRLPSPGDTQIGAETERLEQVLTEHALALGAEIKRGHGVDGFEATNDAVVVRSGAQAFHARWLVGCDGGRSTIRKHGGFDFEGTEPELTGYALHLELADPAALPLGRHQTASGSFTQWYPGAIAIADFDGGKLHRSELTIAHLEEVLLRVTGTRVTITKIIAGSTWTDRSKQATTYRKDRVLLAGDAAHIHSPLGGQGLNLGLGDAMNLGWKLAATVRGDAPDGLLDTYTTERHPVGARILDWTRAQVTLMRPGSQALQAVMRELIATRDGATYFAERVWGVLLKYDLGEAHPLVGRSCPDFELADGRRVGELLRDGGGLLLDFDGKLRALDGRWGERVRYIDSAVKERLGLAAVLVRPDGFVAFACDETPTVEDVVRAAARWFG